MSKLLVCDLDGTLVGDVEPLRTLLHLLEKPGAPILVFATGRQGFSAIDLLLQWKVHKGAYLIAGVGSEMYRRIGKRWLPIAAWPKLGAGWDGERARRKLAAFSNLRPQRIPVSSPYKLSYVAPPESVGPVLRALHSAGMGATVVHSHGDLLDVLPPGIDKGSAVMWLSQRLAIPLQNTLTCGDTANDLSMLRLPCPSIIVGNCDDELRAAAESLPQAFVAREHCAAGIIEGLRRCGWLNGAAWQ